MSKPAAPVGFYAIWHVCECPCAARVGASLIQNPHTREHAIASFEFDPPVGDAAHCSYELGNPAARRPAPSRSDPSHPLVEFARVSKGYFALSWGMDATRFVNPGML